MAYVTGFLGANQITIPDVESEVQAKVLLSCEATMLEIVPALPSWQSTHESGWPRLALLNRLKKSARNWRFSDSFNAMDFDIDRSVSI